MKNYLLILVALGASLLPLRVQGLVLELRDQQTVTCENLTLNDLLSSSQDVSADELASVLADAPSLGKTQTWTRAQIEAVLPSSVKQQTIEWAGATSCVVSRPAVKFTVQQVKQAILAEIGRHLPAQSDYAILEMPDLDAFLIPDGAVDVQVELTNGTLRNEWGEASLEFRSEGQLAVTKSVRFHWAYSRQVWQANASIKGGAQLTAGGFSQVEVNVLTLPGLLQPATDFPEGKNAAHPLAQGSILMDNDWVEPILVNRDDLVTILYDHHGISITVQARAMANGIFNQVIAVQNLTSHKIFNARVVDERSLVYDE